MSALEQVDLVAEAAATEVPKDPWPGRFAFAGTVVHDLHTGEVTDHRSEREMYVHVGGMVQRERALMAADFERGGAEAMAEGHEHRLNRLLARRVQSYGQARARVAGGRS